MSNQWHGKQNRCLRETERLQAVDRYYIDEGARLLELAGNAQRLFAKQETREKGRLLNFLLSNCTWGMGRWSPPSGNRLLLAEIVMIASRAAAAETAKTAKTEIWLSFLL